MSACIVLFAVSKTLLKLREYHNQRKIEKVMTNITYNLGEDKISQIQKLLELKSLTIEQNAEIYSNLAISFYTSNKIEEYLKTVGYAIFFNEQAEKTETLVHLYSLLAQYYLELGADNAGYDTILKARRIKNFYSIKDPLIQSVALHSYARFLIYESDFEDAMKAQAQMEEDAAILKTKNEVLGNLLLSTALAFKSYIMLMQGKTEEAYTLACEVYENFENSHDITHTSVYDVCFPVCFVKTQWAIRNHQYEKAIEFNREYGNYAKKFNFMMKKVNNSKELMFALPDSMAKERTKLFNELALDTDFLAQTYLNNYTDTNAEKLSSVIENLRHDSMQKISRTRTFRFIFVDVMIMFALILIISLIYNQTQVDGLTHLRNRRALNTRIGKLASGGRKYSAIMIDIDNFKKLNDNFGHDFGDEVLRGVASVLIKNEAHNTKAYRYGGEEMVIILEHFDLERAVRFSEHIRNEISAMKWQKDVHVTASFGLGFEMPDSLKEADENMYVAKQKGKNFTAYKKNGKQYLAERRLDIRNPMPDKI